MVPIRETYTECVYLKKLVLIVYLLHLTNRSFPMCNLRNLPIQSKILMISRHLYFRLSGRLVRTFIHASHTQLLNSAHILRQCKFDFEVINYVNPTYWSATHFILNSTSVIHLHTVKSNTLATVNS